MYSKEKSQTFSRKITCRLKNAQTRFSANNMNYQDDRREQAKPVIIHQSLSNSDIITLLRDSNYFIRFSSTVIKDSCIFPSSSVAFLIVGDVFNSRRQMYPQSTRLASVNEQEKHDDSDRCTELLNRMEKFSKLHQRCFVILRYSVFDSFTTESLQNIQLKFLESRLQVIPALSNNGQSVVDVSRILSFIAQHRFLSQKLSNSVKLNKSKFTFLAVIIYWNISKTKMEGKRKKKSNRFR